MIYRQEREAGAKIGLAKISACHGVAYAKPGELVVKNPNPKTTADYADERGS